MVLSSLLKKRLSVRFKVLLAAMVTIMAFGFTMCAAAEAPSSVNRERLRPQPFFERNDGQADPEALYLTSGPGYSASLGRNGVTLTLAHSVSGGGAQSQSVVRLQFPGTSPQTQVQGVEEQPGKSNYFFGSDPARWRTRIPHFAGVAYPQIYPGIDLLFYFHGGQLEYDVQLQPGADRRAVRVRIEGGDVALTADGDVLISSGHNELLRIKRASVYQPGASRLPIPAKYVLRGHELSLVPGAYDRSKPLVIDPALAIATYLGTNCPAPSPTLCSSTVSDMAVDQSGIYLTGYTTASAFPAQPGQPPATEAILQTFVTKLDPTGSKVIYDSFLAASSSSAIAVDSSGAAYVAGSTNFPGSPPFPLTQGSFSPKLPAGQGAVPYVTKLSPDGSTLVYSTLLMLDSNPETLTAEDLAGVSRVAVDSNGAVYVSGGVSSQTLHLGGPQVTSLLPFPTTVGAFMTARPGDGSLYVMKLNPAGSGLDYSTYIGVANDSGLAVDSSGSAYISGSAAAGYPTTPGAFQPNAVAGSASNAVVTKLSPDGSSLVYSTFYGSNDLAEDLALTSAGEAVIVGQGQDSGLPTTPGALCTPTGTTLDTFAAKLNASGSGLVYATTLCVNSNSSLGVGSEAVAVDSSGAAYVATFVSSLPASPSFPFLNPIQSYFFTSGPGQGFTNGLVSLDSSGALRWGTYLGGGDAQTNAPFERIKVDSAGAVYFVGDMFFTTPNGFPPMPSDRASYLAKILPSLGAPVPVLIPGSVSFPALAVGTSSSPVDVMLGDFGDAALGTPTITISPDFSQTNACTAPIPAGQKCDVNVVFKPTAAGTRTGTLTVHFGGSLADQTVALTGTGTAPTATPSPSSLTFPPQSLNTTSSAQQIKISNNGTAPLSISNLQTSGDFAQSNVCGAPVQPGGNCVVQVTFTPTVAGKRQGSLIVTDNALDSPQTIPLSGFGGQASMVSLNPASLVFSAPQNVGSTSSSLSVTLTNIGNVSLNIAHITVAGDFSQTNNCTTVAAGGNCTLQVTFSPTAAGSRNGTLTITDDSITSPETVTSSGMGADFNFPPPPGPTSQTVSAGQTATYNLTVNSQGGSETVSFNCSGLPALASCAFTPSSATLTGVPQNFTVSISTTAASTALKIPNTPPAPPLVFWAMMSVLAIIMMRLHKRMKRAVFASLGVAVLLIGCGGGGGGGGGGHPGTPSGTYTVVVTATASSGGTSLSHSTNVTLIVQ
jgi:hypothetical protein